LNRVTCKEIFVTTDTVKKAEIAQSVLPVKHALDGTGIELGSGKELSSKSPGRLWVPDKVVLNGYWSALSTDKAART
jgi:hypothetical protein